MGLIGIIKPLFIVLSNAVNKSQQHLEKNSCGRQESNRGCWVRSKYATYVAPQRHKTYGIASTPDDKKSYGWGQVFVSHHFNQHTANQPDRCIGIKISMLIGAHASQQVAMLQNLRGGIGAGGFNKCTPAWNILFEPRTWREQVGAV